MSVLQQTLPPSQTELWSHIKLWARALGAGARTCRRAQKSSFNFSYSILPVRADRSSSAGSCFFIKVQDKWFDGQHRPSSRKRLEESSCRASHRGSPSCRASPLQKQSTGLFLNSPFSSGRCVHLHPTPSLRTLCEAEVLSSSGLNFVIHFTF